MDDALAVVTLPEPVTMYPLSPELPSMLAALPDLRGVYVLRTATSVLHLSWSAHVRRRLQRLLRPASSASERFARLLHEQGGYIECWPTGSVLETSLCLYALAVEWFPADYLKRLRLRTPWFVSLTDDPFPRLKTGNRLPSRASSCTGPFSSREAAVRYEEAALSLFQIRRCPESLQPAADHPGCIYGEMNLCLRPCQLQVTAEEYASEAGRVLHFLAAGPQATLSTLKSARDRAAEQLDFECAAQLHRQMEKVQFALDARPDVVVDISCLLGVALTLGCDPHQILLRPFIAGYWQPAVSLELDEENPHAESLDSRLRAALEPVLSKPVTARNRLDDLSLFSRWYYSSYRDDEWFPFDARRGPPYRKLARAISRLMRGRTGAVPLNARERLAASPAVPLAPTNSPAPKL